MPPVDNDDSSSNELNPAPTPSPDNNSNGGIPDLNVNEVDEYNDAIDHTIILPWMEKPLYNLL